MKKTVTYPNTKSIRSFPSFFVESCVNARVFSAHTCRDVDGTGDDDYEDVQEGDALWTPSRIVIAIVVVIVVHLIDVFEKVIDFLRCSLISFKKRLVSVGFHWFWRPGVVSSAIRPAWG